MVLRASEARRSATSSCAGPKIRRKSLARNFASLLAANAVMVFTDILLTRLDATTPPANWKWKERCGKAVKRYGQHLEHVAIDRTPDADSTEAARIDLNWLGNNRDVACYGLHGYDAALAGRCIDEQNLRFHRIFQTPTCHV